MKMMMALMAPADGIIKFRMLEGSALSAGDQVAQLELDNPAAAQVSPAPLTLLCPSYCCTMFQIVVATT